MNFAELAALGAEVGELLKARGEKVAVMDGATGGLVSAALVSVPGATAFFASGGVVYSLKGRDVLLDLPREQLSGMRSVTQPYALLQARRFRERMGAQWGLAETGSAGPNTHPFGVESGARAIAVVGLGVERAITLHTGLDDRTGNMFAFARAALCLLRDVLAEVA